MNNRKRALSINSPTDAEIRTDMKKAKGHDMHMQPDPATQDWDMMEVDSDYYAAREHRYDSRSFQ